MMDLNYAALAAATPTVDQPAAPGAETGAAAGRDRRVEITGRA